MALLETVVQSLIEEKPLDPKYRDHALTGQYMGFRECHILPDWLLIYWIEEGLCILVVSRIGTHTDLFD